MGKPKRENILRMSSENVKKDNSSERNILLNIHKQLRRVSKRLITYITFT